MGKSPATKTKKISYELSIPEKETGRPCEWRKQLRGYGYSNEWITEHINNNELKGIERRERMAREERARQEFVKRMTEKAEAEAAPKNVPVASANGISAPVKNGSKRHHIFGHVVTAVLRWMGKDAWTFDQAKKAMRKLNVPMADATLQAQLRAGVKGERGDPAALTTEQVEALYALIEDKPCPTTSKKVSPSVPGAAKPKPSGTAKPAKPSSSSVKPVKSGTSSKSKKKLKGRKKR